MVLQADAVGNFAMVTGAGSGIGRAVALSLIRDGLHTYLVGRDVKKLADVAAHAPKRATVVRADLATPDGIATAAAAARRLQILVHSAGRYLRRPIASISAEEWSALDAVNQHAPILLTAACLPQLKATGGQVVFVNSSASQFAGPGLTAYAAGKRGLQAAVDVLRQEVNADGIRVLTVFPGRTDTRMQQAILAAEGRSAGPGTLLAPEDVAAMIIAALRLPLSAEVTDITIRPMRSL